MTTIACIACAKSVECTGDGNCWCMKLPHQPMPADAAGCLCEDCLAARQGRQPEAPDGRS